MINLLENTNALISSFRKRSSHSDTAIAFVDEVDWYDLTGNDNISQLTFGDPFNCIGSKYVHPWNRMLYEFLGLRLSNFSTS